MRDFQDITRNDGMVIDQDWSGSLLHMRPAFQENTATANPSTLRYSPLARRISIFNLIALSILAAGILLLKPTRDTLLDQHAALMRSEVALIANALEVTSTAFSPLQAGEERAAQVVQRLNALDLRPGLTVFVFGASSQLSAFAQSAEPAAQVRPATPFVDALNWVWTRVFAPPHNEKAAVSETLSDRIAAFIRQNRSTDARIDWLAGPQGSDVMVALAPISLSDPLIAQVVLASATEEIDALVAVERERVLQMFVIAIVVSVGLSLSLSATIANPLSALAAAAETGRGHRADPTKQRRIRIPDFSDRPDEIGRLSGALRGMVAALYRRTDATEQFAADVAHEIKNPLASLRSAVDALDIVQNDAQRAQLVGVMTRDIQRLDRLVTDISNASRLDAELVKDARCDFDVLKTVSAVATHFEKEARAKDVLLTTDFPAEAIFIQGFEARLAQVFVNLITNALSFCEEGDAIRIWVRRRENRVLVVVEDTGPGIPEEALSKVFERFYSHRPQESFGQHSGLGLAISKQIVEAHQGVIWAENIEPTSADITSSPLGARFVVGLPV
ncbi:MAG: ATP-binding protein [Pseudomonadota bacterium]